MRPIKSVWLWLRYIFNSERPNISSLNYVTYIIEGKSYFVFSWEMENAYRLKIKSANYKSNIKSGSAYMAIRGEVERLEIIVSNSWRSKKYLLKLRLISINETIDFQATLQHQFEAEVKLPKLKAKSSNLKVNALKVSLSNQVQLKRIINISYPN